MGATDVAKPVEEFVKNNPQYEKFARWMISMHLTPIFEWCSRKQRIVLDYKEDQLVLTAIRHLHNGHYAKHDSMVKFVEGNGDIPVVRVFNMTNYGEQNDTKAFLEYVHDLEDLEGFVVRFDSGHMVKLKCHWYVQIHKAKESILQDRNIVEMILENSLDDIKAHVLDEDRIKLINFEYKIEFFLHEMATCLFNRVEYYTKTLGLDRKTYAIKYGDKELPYLRPLVFKLFDDNSPALAYDAILNMVRNNLGSNTKYNQLRDEWFDGAMYND